MRKPTPESEYRYRHNIVFQVGDHFAEDRADDDEYNRGVVHVREPDFVGDGSAFIEVVVKPMYSSKSSEAFYFDPTDLENLATLLLFTAKQARKNPRYHNRLIEGEI